MTEATEATEATGSPDSPSRSAACAEIPRSTWSRRSLDPGQAHPISEVGVTGRPHGWETRAAQQAPSRWVFATGSQLPCRPAGSAPALKLRHSVRSSPRAASVRTVLSDSRGSGFAVRALPARCVARNSRRRPRGDSRGSHPRCGLLVLGRVVRLGAGGVAGGVNAEPVSTRHRQRTDPESAPMSPALGLLLANSSPRERCSPREPYAGG